MKIKWKESRKWSGKIIFFSLCFLLFLFCSDSVLAENDDNIKENLLYAKAAVLMDGETGRVLYGKNQNEILPMASTTKILTCILALENGNLCDVVEVSKYASTMPDVQLNIKEDEKYYLGDLLYSLMLESHNDVAVAIAEHIAGSVETFAELMNQKAIEIGCENSFFLTPNGLDAQAVLTDENGNNKKVSHSTTARDLALIMSYCITKSPCREKFLEITQKKNYEFKNLAETRNFHCRNHNALLYSMNDAISGKTGFTGDAGYCYVGAIQNQGRTFIVALLACGWPYNKNYKWKDCGLLFRYGREHYQIVQASGNRKSIGLPDKILVKEGQFPLGLDENEQSVTIHILDENYQPSALLNKNEQWKVEFKLQKEIQAPVKENQKVGELYYSIDDKIYYKKDIVVKDKINECNFQWCVKELFRYFYNRYLF